MSIVVIGILLAIALPTLVGARRAAGEVECLGRLGGLLKAFHAKAEATGSRWPNIAPVGDASHVYTYSDGPGHSSVTGGAYFDQTLLWTALIGGTVSDDGGSGPSVEPYSCPAVVSDLREAGTTSPRHAGAASFMYSAALVSDPSLWRDSAEGEAARASEAERRRAWVLTSAVAHPSRKVALAEIADHHGSGRALDDPGADAVNAAFADGHAERVDLRHAQPAFQLTFSTRTIWRPERPVPFSAAKDGYLGHDY